MSKENKIFGSHAFPKRVKETAPYQQLKTCKTRRLRSTIFLSQ